MRGSIKRFLGVLLSVAIVIAFVPEFSLTTHAIDVEYDIWVGGVRVTGANASNIMGDETARYDAVTKTLTLNGFNYEGEGHKVDRNAETNYAGIYSEQDLKIILQGDNYIKCTANSNYFGDGIQSYHATLTIKGPGTLSVVGNERGTSIVVFSDSLFISGGTIYTYNNSDYGAFGLGTSGNKLFINDAVVNAAGNDGALAGNVINTVVGTGWSDVDGTTGRTDIAVNTLGKFYNYKRVRFPAPDEPAKVTIVPAAKSLVENASAQELVIAGKAEGGKMQYALGKDDITAPTDGWSDSIPTATAVGTYYVWYKAIADFDHIDSDPKSVKAIISPKQEVPTDLTPEKETGTVEPEKKDTKTSYKNEWVDHQWYDSNGNATYKYKGYWKCNEKGWWFEDEKGWYPQDQWQKIDGKWYFFDTIGYMAQNEYAGSWGSYSEGNWWVGDDGAWDGSEPGVWRLSTNGKWWFKDSTGWYAKSKWYKIRGTWYYFDDDGWWDESKTE